MISDISWLWGQPRSQLQSSRELFRPIPAVLSPFKSHYLPHRHLQCIFHQMSHYNLFKSSLSFLTRVGNWMVWVAAEGKKKSQGIRYTAKGDMGWILFYLWPLPIFSSFLFLSDPHCILKLSSILFKCLSMTPVSLKRNIFILKNIYNSFD